MSLSTTDSARSGQHSQQEIASAIHNAVIFKRQQKYADHWRQIKPMTGPSSISCALFDLTIHTNQSIPPQFTLFKPPSGIPPDRSPSVTAT